MLNDMMGKLQAMKQQADEIKNRLENISVKGEAGNGGVIVVINGNKLVKNVSIKDEILKHDKEEIEDLILTAVNRALREADAVHEREMQQAAGGLFPGIF